MSWPVSVIIPLSASRKWFFDRYCLPSVRYNDAMEVWIERQEGKATVKRNEGAVKATQPYLLFVDDDTVLGGDCIERMVTELEKHPEKGFVYSDYMNVVFPDVPNRGNRVFPMKAKPWNWETLKHANYIDTTSLVRKSVFPGFDPELVRLQDWDLWLTLGEQGISGAYIPESLFFKFSIDAGITGTVPIGPAHEALARKHRL